MILDSTKTKAGKLPISYAKKTFFMELQKKEIKGGVPFSEGSKVGGGF